jgi:delta-aminolevulinic acid dehydratase/porphobilinogen synthase
VTLNDYAKTYNILHYLVKYRIKSLDDVVTISKVYVIECDKNDNEKAKLDEIKKDIAEGSKIFLVKPEDVEILSCIPIPPDIISLEVISKDE